MALSIAPHAPIYQQVADQICNGIASGLYRAGGPVPSVRALAEQLLINPNTIHRAYRELEHLGLVETRRGLGMFVTADGPTRAEPRATAALEERFSQGVRLARAAGMSPDRIRAVFERALDNEASSRPLGNALPPSDRKGDHP